MDYRTCIVIILLLCCSTHGEKCSCHNGCDSTTGEPTQMYPNKINVAVGKVATVSSSSALSHPLTTGARCNACLPVNGLWSNSSASSPAAAAAVGNLSMLNHTFLHQGSINSSSIDSGSCMLCEFMAYGGWWQVDLGHNYTVTDLAIYTDDSNSLEGLHIFVDGYLCLVITDSDHAFHNVSEASEAGRRRDLQCAWPINGRVVRFSKPSALDEKTTPEIRLCEVMVWACKTGYYGDTCNLTCDTRCHGNSCDRHNGTCPKACQTGYYGDTCNLTCSRRCHGNTCDPLNGTCLKGCQEGYYGDTCDLKCKGHCQGNTCDQRNGTCIDECRAGYYGETCNLKCKGHCHDNACDKLNGTCHDGCAAGYYGEMCDQKCLSHCRGNTCNRLNGTCPGDCADGYYGADCRSQCGQCADPGTCNRETGQCEGSGCQFSWTGEFCTVNTHECACAEPENGGCVKLPAMSPDGVVNKENVAFGKKASMSSRYKDGQGLSPPACAAVNGKTMTTYRSVTEWDPNCVHSTNQDFSPWWKVDLGRAYTITGVTIYRRADYYHSSKRMAGARVWVDEHLCYTFPDSNNTQKLLALHHKISVTCAQPVRGQEVTFSKDGDDNSHYFYPINICEFQVWVCKDGFYGKLCNQTCSKRCPGGLCDNYYGTCLKEVNASGRGGPRSPHAGYPPPGSLLAGAIAGGFLLVAVSIFIIGICHCRRQKRKNQASSRQGVQQVRRDTAAHAAPPPYYQNPAFDTSMDTTSQPGQFLAHGRGRMEGEGTGVSPRGREGEEGEDVHLQSTLAVRPSGHPHLTGVWEPGLPTKAAGEPAGSNLRDHP